MPIEPSYIWSCFQFSFTIGQGLFLIRSWSKFTFLIGPESLHQAVLAPPPGPLEPGLCTCMMFVIFAIKAFYFLDTSIFPLINQFLLAKPSRGTSVSFSAHVRVHGTGRYVWLTASFLIIECYCYMSEQSQVVRVQQSLHFPFSRV